MASGIRYGGALLLSVLLAACGGGGGGGGSTSGDGGSSAYGVRVLHAAIDGAPVDVTSLVVTTNSGESRQIAFGDPSDYVPVSPGSVHLSASRVVDGNLVVSTNRTLEEGHAYTLLISGEIGHYVKSTLLVDE